MRIIVAAGAVLTALAGCMPFTPTARPFDDSLDRLANLSRQRVAVQSRTVETALQAGQTEAQIVAAAQETVADSLKDPESARFRGVAIKTYNGNRIVCGEVNAKNSYGGYVGYEPFVAGFTSSTLLAKDSQYPDIQRASNAGLMEACIYTATAAQMPTTDGERAKDLAGQLGCSKDAAVVFHQENGWFKDYNAFCASETIKIRCDGRSCWRNL